MLPKDQQMKECKRLNEKAVWKNTKIQRLIGRSLRQVVDLDGLTGYTVLAVAM